MAFYSSLFANQVAGGVTAVDDQLKVEVGLQHGRLRSTLAEVVIPTGQATGTLAGLALVKPSDRIFSLRWFQSAAQTGAVDWDIGLYQTDNNRSILTRVGAVNSIADLNGAGTAGEWSSSDAMDDGILGKTFYEVAGLSAAPTYSQFMMAIEVGANATDEEATVSIQFQYTSGD
mgnify:CR=1 FL=1